MKKTGPGASKFCQCRSTMVHVHKVAGNLLYSDIVFAFAFAVAECESAFIEIANTVMETSHTEL